MPLYEYLCEACGRRTEALQRLDEPPLTVCPHCEGKLRKLLSAPAFQFKGSGWYLTDYARKSGGGDASAGSSGDSGSAGASSDSSAGTSKPATGGSGESSAPAKPAAKAGDD